jgi:HEPN domain-containing protein
MNDKASHARQWLAKAHSDLTASRRLLDGGGPYDAVCFHAQQAAEKALKAWLAVADAPIPRTHNLEDLQALCLALSPPEIASGLEALDLSELTPFAVESRYDIEFWPSRGEAEGAVFMAARVCAAVTRIVGAEGSPSE